MQARPLLIRRSNISFSRAIRGSMSVASCHTRRAVIFTMIFIMMLALTAFSSPAFARKSAAQSGAQSQSTDQQPTSAPNQPPNQSPNQPANQSSQQAATVFDPTQAAAQLDQLAQQAALDIARLRIDKWKADSSYRQQSQASADSISRNLTSALPTLTAAVRTKPTSLLANMKLYRNLNALYDVTNSLAESAGAFGPKQEFESIGRYVGALDDYRRGFGDYLERLAASADSAPRAATPAAGTKNKKVIIDDTAPTPRKKKRPKS